MEKTIKLAMKHLIEEVEKMDTPQNLHSAIGEISINGVTYQIQLSFNVDKRLWCGTNEVLIVEVEKKNRRLNT